jgi:hypothetical protein
MNAVYVQLWPQGLDPRLKEDHKLRFSAAPASRLQILLLGLIVSMT